MSLGLYRVYLREKKGSKLKTGRVYFSGCLPHNTGILKRGQKLANTLKTEEVKVYSSSLLRNGLLRVCLVTIGQESDSANKHADSIGHSSLGCEWTSHSGHSLHCRSLKVAAERKRTLHGRRCAQGPAWTPFALLLCTGT